MSVLSPRFYMRPIGWIGVLLILGGAIVVTMRGVGYTKNRNEIEVGPLRVAAVEKGFVSPIVGVVAILVGAALVYVGRRRSA